MNFPNAAYCFSDTHTHTQEIGCPLLKCNQIGVEADAVATAGDGNGDDAVAEVQQAFGAANISLWPAPNAGQEQTGQCIGPGTQSEFNFESIGGHNNPQKSNSSSSNKCSAKKKNNLQCSNGDDLQL